MPDRPLLFFPIPTKASWKGKGRNIPKPHAPSVLGQGKRLSPMFAQLQAAFESQRIEIQHTTAGVEPEQVLVIETIGGVDKFSNAVKKIEGLEWMGEIATDDITPDSDFYDEEHPDKLLNGRLYLIMSNSRALEEMVSLWKRYVADPNMEFAVGLANFRNIFSLIKTIRHWDVQDRLLDTGIIDAWKEDIEIRTDNVISFEMELWFRGTDAQRNASKNRVTELIQQSGGRITAQSTISDIAYHGLLGELPKTIIQEIIDNQSIELVKCESIMFFRPVGQMVAGKKPVEGKTEAITVDDMPLPTGKPVIAILDGMPLENHTLLSGRLIVDDPDDWAANYPAAAREHGTSMASLVIHGDLNLPAKPLTRPVYIRPIMQSRSWYPKPYVEEIPENCLAVDLVHRAVKRLFESDSGEPPVAPTVKIINFSIGDIYRQFTNTMSPLARLLDWLSVKYNVLFIVSAGNHAEPIILEITETDSSKMNPNELEQKTILSIYADTRNKKLLSPAETINGLTVGAIQDDVSNITNLGDRINPFTNILPNPVSAFGSGYRRSVKPDIVYSGGRQLYRLSKQADKISLNPVIAQYPPGNKSATPGQSGNINNTSYTCGTSNATALLTRAAGVCYDSLLQLIDEQDAEISSNCETPLLKAMLVHGCSWREMGQYLSNVIRNSQNAHNLKRLVSNWIGYGIPQVERVLDCTEQRATVLGFGHLSDGEAHIFTLPLPPSLGSRPVWRRLTATLAWLSPVSPNTQKYRNVSLWFDKFDALSVDRTDADWQAVKNGTVQHEIFEGGNADPFVDGDTLKIKINCRSDAGKTTNPVAYGLVVSLEVAEDVDIAVYGEIQQRIKPAVQIQQNIANRG
jgi:hypothetical protein